MPNTARCFWVTDVTDIRQDGDCMRVELSDDVGTIVLRGSLHTLLEGLELGKRAVKRRATAEIIPLRHN